MLQDIPRPMTLLFRSEGQSLVDSTLAPAFSLLAVSLASVVNDGESRLNTRPGSYTWGPDGSREWAADALPLK